MLARTALEDRILSHIPQKEPPKEKVHRTPWCLRCCTMHEKDERCPRESLATGAERYGWRAGIVAPNRTSAFGVLLAPVGRSWRARIVTFPNILWVVPGGGPMKFLGNTTAIAERKAIKYITEHCKDQAWIMKVEIPTVESKKVDLEQDPQTATSVEIQASQRRLHTIPIRYGINRPTETSTTGDLSEGGLFIVTAKPLPVGTNLKLHISLDGFGLPQHGIVQWTRDKPADGRPPGMGLKLILPHRRFVAYVRKHRAEEPDDDGEAVPGEIADKT